MEFSNPNQFKKIKKLEGAENSEDIWDIYEFDKIKNQIEKQTSFNIKELIDKDESIVEFQECLSKTRSFCDEVSKDFKQQFLCLLDQYRKERRQIPQKIIDYLSEKDFIFPNFIIAVREQAQKLLEEYGFQEEINNQDLLLVFQLPKPLAKFWWKGGADSWGGESIDIEDRAIEWGHFYRELLPIIWETQGRYEDEKGLDFYRINEIGEHDPEKYYYIWKMSEW